MQRVLILRDLYLSRARATSAAPSYFKAFKSNRNSRGYLDGALYHNNPVRVAELERRLIWPDTGSSPPDILLSIGTSCNAGIQEAAQEALRRGYDPMTDQSMTTLQGSRHGLFRRKRKGTEMSKLIKVLKNRVEDILDTEATWLKFLSDVVQGDEEDRSRYRRINPDIGEEPPRLDEADQLPRLQQRVQEMTKNPRYQKQIGGVARCLVASCFYVEISSLPTNFQERDTAITGMIIIF